MFLLAHPRDELLFAPIIHDAKREGRRLTLVYLTAPVPMENVVVERDLRGATLLGELGIDLETEVIDIGSGLGVACGRLCNNLLAVHTALRAAVEGMLPIEQIYVHAWEGGSVDHDSAHALALGLAAALQRESIVLQVPFMRASHRACFPTLFLAPLAENGPVAFYPLTWQERFWWMRLSARYPNTKCLPAANRTALLGCAAIKPGVPIQSASAARLRRRPMQGQLRYERLGRGRFETMLPLIDAFWHAISGPERGHAEN